MQLMLETGPQKEYELLDSGEGEKLERYGDVIVSRPDPQALWKKRLSVKEWDKADATFTKDSDGGKWIIKKKGMPEEWQILLGGLTFIIKPTTFKHTGIFPEQVSNWEWMQNIIGDVKAKENNRTPSVLNLFGYTGGATLACASAGAEVCHVDGSKAAVTWARKNAEASGLGSAPVRWIIDDVSAFIKREAKRGRKYDGIVMDPPAFGRGPNGEVWKIEDEFLKLLESCRAILSDKPLFVLVNGYASGYSPVAYKNALGGIMSGMKGKVESGEVAIQESSVGDMAGRSLPAGIIARWSRD